MPIFFAQLAHLCSQNVHIWQKFPPFTKYPYLPKMPISAQDDQLRQLCGRSLSVRCIDPAVDDGEEQGHQEVPRRALRVWEDHHCQGWGLGDTSPTKWFQVIKASRCLDGEINPLGIYPWFNLLLREKVSCCKGICLEGFMMVKCVFCDWWVSCDVNSSHMIVRIGFCDEWYFGDMHSVHIF